MKRQVDPTFVLQHEVEVPRREWPGTNGRERGPLVLSKDRIDPMESQRKMETNRNGHGDNDKKVLWWIGDMDAKNGSE